eukprot:COSAG06_NODE_3486_length_5273_cov_83.329532_1_plen_179_part_00
MAYRVVTLSMLRREAVGSDGVSIHHQAVVAVAAALAVLDIRTPEPDVVQDRVGGIHLHHYARRHPVDEHTRRHTHTQRERERERERERHTIRTQARTCQSEINITRKQDDRPKQQQTGAAAFVLPRISCSRLAKPCLWVNARQDKTRQDKTRQDKSSRLAKPCLWVNARPTNASIDVR